MSADIIEIASVKTKRANARAAADAEELANMLLVKPFVDRLAADFAACKLAPIEVYLQMFNRVISNRPTGDSQ